MTHWSALPAHERRAVLGLAALLAVLVALPVVISGYLLSVAILILYFAYTGQAWNVMMGFAGQLSLGHTYGYQLEPVDGGTLVTSYYDWSDIHPQWREAGIFPVMSELALRATLGILARTVAPGRPRPTGD